MKFRKKPVEIEAEQWWKHGDYSERGVVGLYRHPPVDPATGEVSAGDSAILMGRLRHCETPERFRRPTCEHLMHDHGWIDTLEGGHVVCPGDWIITGVQGERYPCKPDIFAATYDEVPAADAGDQAAGGAQPGRDRNQSRWSTRYYRTDCPDYHDGAQMVFATHGPDDRADPGPDKRIQCWITGHGEHAALRISPSEFEAVGKDEDGEDT